VSWSLAERSADLCVAAREGVDLLVVGGGITGAAVARDAASRGLSVLVVERDDFASGTSSRSSKLIHGGLRYIAEGQLGVTRESCRERDLLVRQNPNLVRTLPFLFPAWKGGKVPLWQVRAALSVYAGLAGFRRSARFRMADADGVGEFCPDLKREGLRGAGVYHDAQVDDARLVLEVVKGARRLGAGAVNHAEVIAFERDSAGRLCAAHVRDRLSGQACVVRAGAVVNAAGPGVERVRGLDRSAQAASLRPAKGVHLVIPRRRIPSRGAVTFEALDGRHLFLVPWDDVAILGTTDTWSDQIDEPVVTIGEVHYLLAAANAAFPDVALTTNDLRAVFAGVRPLVAPAAGEGPSSRVSRESHVWEDPSGLVSAAGGKLTTHRATAQGIVDRALRHLPAERRRAAGPSRTAELPLRADEFDRAELKARLAERFGVDDQRAKYLVRTWGAAAETLFEEAPPALHAPIGATRFTLAEIPWSLRHECAAGLCDLLEHRLRFAIFAEGQGLTELDTIARVAGDALGWDAERRRAESVAYREAVRTRYQIRLDEPVASAAASASAAA
jgi:glycerol-3-phosphate dehydrogenase